MLSHLVTKLGKLRKEILLAELGALLHNVGKVAPAFREDQRQKSNYVLVSGRTINEAANPLVANRFSPQSDLARTSVELADLQLESIPAVTLPEPFNDPPSYSVTDLAAFHPWFWFDRDKSIHKTFAQTFRLAELMAWSHEQASGQEKRNVEQEQVAKARTDADGPEKPRELCTVFGLAGPIEDPNETINTLAQALRALQKPEWTRKEFDTVSEAMRRASADTRRPINDVTVADIGAMGAAFFKAGLSEGLQLGAWPKSEPRECPFRWLLLRVAVDGSDFLSRATRIPDLLARRKLFGDMLDHVRRAFEFEWLLGNEIYRDQGGSVFLVSGMFGPGQMRNELEQLVQTHWQSFEEQLDRDRVTELGKELTCTLQWSGDQGFALGDQGENSYRLGALIERTPPRSAVLGESLKAWWSGNVQEVCSVCGLRPMGPGRKELSRKVCHVCEQRRQSRAEAWLSGLSSNSGRTVWMEEVQDSHGRVALITARFRLQPWLRQGGYIETTMKLGETKQGQPRFKSPSFARLARVWRTAEQFWKDALAEIESALPSPGPRLRLSGTFTGTDLPVRQHTYLLDLDGYRFSAVCERGGAEPSFVLAENQSRTADQLGLRGELSEYLAGRQFEVQVPTGYGSENSRLGRFGPALGEFVSDTAGDGWKPLIEIQLDPETVMFLVPAVSAWTAARTIEQRYRQRMGKVQNRLGLDLGIVYAPAITPVHAILDAGRRMIQGMSSAKEVWTLADNAPETFARVLTFSNGASFSVPTHFHPGTSGIDDEVDKWYPYFETTQGLKLASDLTTGDSVQIEPSRFDFQFLDSSARRFEISYAGNRRREPWPQRPWRLDQLGEFERVWTLLAEQPGLAMNQIKTLDGLLAAKREAWGALNLLPGFIRDVLQNREWRRGLSPADVEFLTNAAQSGLMEDAIELFLGIEKRPAGDSTR